MVATPGIMCKFCLDVLYESPSVCKCSNLAILIDDDQHIHLYVDDIRDTQRTILYHTGDFREATRILLQEFSKEIYVDYSYVANNPLHYQPIKKKHKYERKTSTEYDQKLIHVLDLHKHATSDGVEEFHPTALNDSKKK